MRKNAISIIVFITASLFIVVLISLSSCSRNGKPELVIEITDPKTGSQFYATRQVMVTSVISGKETWSRVELWANNILVQSRTAAQVQSSTVTQAWTPIQNGATMLEVRVYNRAGKDYVSDKVAVTIIDLPGVLTPEPTVVPGEPTPTVAPTEENCSVGATLLADLSNPAGTELKAGQSFTKSWRVHNNGTCDWVDYKLVYISGSIMGGNSPNLMRQVRAGEVIDIALELVAPSFPGEYTGVWKIQTDTGSLIDVELKYTIIIPGPTATPSPTATQTPTNTAVPTKTNTPTATVTPTNTPTQMPSPTSAPTQVPSPTPEPTAVPVVPQTIIVMNPQDIASGETLELSVSCDGVGGRSVSGGYTITNGIDVRASQAVLNGWSITAVNRSGAKQRISVHANCLVDPNLDLRIDSVEGIAKAEENTKLELNLDNPPTFIAYQLDNTGTLSLQNLNASADKALIEVENLSKDEIPFEMQVLTLKNATYHNMVVYPKADNIKTGQSKQINLTCNQGLALGANYANPNKLFVSISRPTLNGWLFEVMNNTAEDIEFNSALICFDMGFDTIQPITVERELF